MVVSVESKSCDRKANSLCHPLNLRSCFVVITLLLSLQFGPKANAYSRVSVIYQDDVLKSDTEGTLRRAYFEEDLEKWVREKLWPAIHKDVRSQLAATELEIRFQTLLTSDPQERRDCSDLVAYFDERLQSKTKSVVLAKPCLLDGSYSGALLQFPILAHEIFHSIHYRIHKDEPSWVREGMAQLFEFLVEGAWNTANILKAYANPSTSLTLSRSHTPKPSSGERLISSAQYGHQLLYFKFLMDRCGGRDLFWSLVMDRPDLFGEENISWVLARSSAGVEKKPVECSNFDLSALEFEISRFENAGRYLATVNPLRRSLFPTTVTSPVLSRIGRESLGLEQVWTPYLLGSSWDDQSVLSKGSSYRVWLEKRLPYRARSMRPPIEEERWWDQVVIAIPATLSVDNLPTEFLLSR